MTGYIYRRIALGLVTLLFVSVLSFVIIQLPPGDFVTTYIAELSENHKHITDERAAALRSEYGLDHPVYVQYLLWMNKVVHGDFGVSLAWKRPVSAVIGDRLWLTMILSFGSLTLGMMFALPMGIYSAVRQYSVGDYALTFFSFVGLGIPDFLISLVLLYLGFVIFHANIGGLFSAAYANAAWTWGKVLDLLKHLPLPLVILGLLGVGGDIRILRANLLDEMRKPYVISARAKGLSERRLLLKYPLRVALNPFVAGAGGILPALVSGSVIVSLVLSLPTLGPVFLGALESQDMFLAGTIVLMLGALTIVGMLVSDLLLAWVDPRIRFGR